MRLPSFIIRSLIRLAAGGSALLVAVWLGGQGLEQQRFGPDEAAARVRVAALVEDSVRELEARLQRVVEEAAVDAAQLQLASQGEPAAEHQLFVELTESAGRVGLDVSATVYGTTALPVAWTGRPLEVPDIRLAGPEAVFLVPDAQGLRLIRVHPLNNPADQAQRAGTLVVQAPLARSDPDGQPGDYVLPTSLVSVTVRPRFQGGADAAPDEFLIHASNGDTLASVSASPTALARARDALRGRVQATLLALVAVILLLATGPLLDWRRVSRRNTVGVIASVLVATLLIVAWMLFRAAISASGLLVGPRLAGGSAPAWLLPESFFASPLHFLAASLLVAGLTAHVASSLDAWRLALRRAGRPLLPTAPAFVLFLAAQVAAGAVVAALVVGYEAFLRHGVAGVPADILHFGLRPWDWPRLAIVTGVIILNASVVTAAVVVYRLALARYAVRSLTLTGRVLTGVAWLGVPVLVMASGVASRWAPTLPALLVVVAMAAIAWRIGYIRSGLRNASQAARLLALVLGLVLPSLVFYASLVDAAERARRTLVETRYAPEVLDQRRTLQARLAETLANIDRVEGLDDLVRAADPVVQGAPPVDAAFLVWSQTELARLRITSSIELYNPTGALVSRFSLKLPDITGAQSPTEGSCSWDVFEEVSPFFAEERRLLHAGRAICVTGPGGRQRRVGHVVVHLMLDYGNLSFVSAQSPYVAMLQSGRTESGPPPHTPVNFAVYGWSGKVLYTSESRAWPLDVRAADRAALSRVPFWITLDHDGRTADAYVLNNRGGIYVLSTWTVTGFGHLIVMAELVSLAFLTFVCGVVGAFVYGLVAARTPTSGRALFREVRASFYRKLFLAFVASAVVPVVALAFVARAYFASLMFADIEMEATRTASRRPAASSKTSGACRCAGSPPSRSSTTTSSSG